MATASIDLSSILSGQNNGPHAHAPVPQFVQVQPKRKATTTAVQKRVDIMAKILTGGDEFGLEYAKLTITQSMEEIQKLAEVTKRIYNLP